MIGFTLTAIYLYIILKVFPKKDKECGIHSWDLLKQLDSEDEYIRCKVCKKLPQEIHENI